MSTTYGIGDGSTTFNLPDLRGRTIAGKDDMGGSAASRLTSTYFGTSAAALGAVGGGESHTLTTAEMPVHNHTITDPGHTHNITSGLFVGSSNSGSTGGANSTPTSTFDTGGLQALNHTTGITLA